MRQHCRESLLETALSAFVEPLQCTDAHETSAPRDDRTAWSGIISGRQFRWELLI